MNVKVNVKVCGIRRYEDARDALDAGAWALGFIFYPGSKRCIDPAEAARIVRRLPAGSMAVGVFVDEPLDRVHSILRESGLRGAQLHGDEGAEYARAVRADLVIKALRVGPGFDVETVRSYPGCRILLDTRVPGSKGGTGLAFDWSIARRAGEIAPIILAGGIGPENVEEAVYHARPDAVDVSSGVESASGWKDPALITRLFEAVKRCEGAAGAEGEAPGPPGGPPDPGGKETRTW